MTARLLVAVVTACLVFPAGASWAHRIDEYLQATLLSLTTDHLAATVRLIPGALVSASVIAAIDRNGDGVLSADEKRDYAQHVLDVVSIRIDDDRVEPRLISWRFPEPSEMLEGM
jgi:hypothetical protein